MTNIEQYSFYNQWYNYLLKIALNYTNDLDTAKEIVQLSFIKIFNKYEDHNTNIKSWCATICKNTALDSIRNSKRIQTCEFTDYNISDEESTDLEYLNENLPKLNKAIDKLKDGYKKIILEYLKGYNYIEISQNLNIHHGTVKSQMYKAKKILKTYLS